MKTIDIFGKLVSKLKGGYVASADQVFDETIGKYQSEINQESGDTGVDNKINALVEKMPPQTRGYINSDGWAEFLYDGPRIEAPSPQRIAAGVYGEAVGGQALAIYGDKLFRLTDGGGLRIYKFVEGGFQHLASLTMDKTEATEFQWHCNSAQFAPTVESGQTYPLLYVAGLYGGKCYVERISEDNGTFSTSLVQTITITQDVLLPVITLNIQIGDDGHIYATGIDGGSRGVFAYKYRKVLPTEGNVTLSESDIIDYVYTNVDYTYADKPWQGCKIYDGKMFFFYGRSAKMGFYVVDLANKVVLNDIDMSNMVPAGEYEDGDFSDGILYIGYWPGGSIVKVAFR